MLELHDMLMKDLNVGVKAELSEEQKEELAEMINQPAKSNTEIKSVQCCFYWRSIYFLMEMFEFQLCLPTR